jgi:hypothetical protein
VRKIHGCPLNHRRAPLAFTRATVMRECNDALSQS